ncbi:unnamed protein product [Vitrella brassicaformis CCMP3155]|uniref:FZ domain-containing protein n=2 Tax=Vitrella brassicaformis TaxID=1169539 RepID=A0A0G4ESK0_VITBC|nr:unnamed protein product [Vitrella brassicaformis CCMP3155]|eukprot:CEM00661.1 unnamed protein product [Vitrella brassicaformis CCMP3155]
MRPSVLAVLLHLGRISSSVGQVTDAPLDGSNAAASSTSAPPDNGTTSATSTDSAHFAAEEDDEIDLGFPSDSLPVDERAKCFIGREKSGLCADEGEVRQRLSFCRDAVRYRACIPPRQRYFPSWDATRKDQVLESLFKQQVEARIKKETNITREKDTPMYLTQNEDCQNAYKNFLCWFNFPRCSANNESLPLCRPSCTNYFEACKIVPAELVGDAECESLAMGAQFADEPDCTGRAGGVNDGRLCAMLVLIAVMFLHVVTCARLSE